MSFYTIKGSESYTRQDREIQAILDELRATVPPSDALRGNTRTNPHRARIKELFESYGFPPAYTTSFWIAYAENRPWHRRLWDKTHFPDRA